jgi:formate dehydrogenase subunit gamma
MSTRGRRIVRYAFRERLVHGLAAVSYVYLLLTGLAFWTPHLFWIAVVLGGGYFSRMLHPWVGLVFTIAVVLMWVVWRRDMKVAPEDRAWRAAMAHYVRNEDAQVPAAGRFNYGQKMLFWVMALGGVALLASGLVLWFVDSVPWQLRSVRFAATLLHAVAALATIGGFIVHLYMGLFVVPGGGTAILHGEVSEEWARAHHPLWLAGMKTMADRVTRPADARHPPAPDVRPRL